MFVSSGYRAFWNLRRCVNPDTETENKSKRQSDTVVGAILPGKKNELFLPRNTIAKMAETKPGCLRTMDFSSRFQHQRPAAENSTLSITEDHFSTFNIHILITFDIYAVLQLYHSNHPPSPNPPMAGEVCFPSLPSSFRTTLQLTVSANRGRRR